MRNLLTLILIALSLSANARQISSDEAIAIASDVLNTSISPSGQSPVKVKRVRTVYDRAESTPYYIYTKENAGGFAIIAGDDRARRILGYSDNATFDIDNVPPQLKDLLDYYAEQISNISASATHPSWKMPYSTADASEGILLETANWGQGAPYNRLTPTFDGAHAPTGCVATAMAIVMKYNSWPSTYDWNTMPSEKIDETNYTQIAQLMKDAGESVHMEYGATESSANMNWVGHRFYHDFNFSSDCQFITRRNFSDEQWASMIYTNLANGHPIIYTGHGTGAHAFVIDGIKEDIYHINWGWDGQFNGYFALDALQLPNGQYFSEDCGMVINIIPGDGNRIYSEVMADYGYFWANNGCFSFMNFDTENITQEGTFTFLHNILSYPPGFKGLVGLALVDANNHIKEVLRYTDINTYSEVDGGYILMGQGLGFNDVRVNADIDSSDRLQLVAKANGEEWKLIAGTIEAPATAPVTGNSPKFVTCSYDFDNNLDVYMMFDPGNKRLHSATAGTINVLAGTNMAVSAYKADREAEGLIEISTHDSNILNGNIYLSSEESIWYAWLLSDDININGKLKILGETSLNVTAGNLETIISKEDAEHVKSLTLTGTMNALDFKYIQANFKYLESIDIKGVKILGIEEQSFLTIQHQDDYLPEYALWNMPRLCKIELPSGLKGIGQYSMSGLKLVNIIIPKYVHEIGENALSSNYSLENVVLLNPQPISIEPDVFANSNFEESVVLFVPEGYKETYSHAEVWQDFEQIIQTDHPEEFLEPILKDGIIYKLHGEIAKVQGNDNPAENVDIQEFLTVDTHRCPVKEIAANAFEYSHIRSIVIPNTVTEIGTSAFSFSYNLKSVVLSKNVTKIPSYAFYQCTALNQLENTEQIKELEGYAFEGTAFKNFKIHKDMYPVNVLLSPFSNMRELERFEVDAENRHYHTINGALYRINENLLEYVPGQVSDDFLIWDGTITIGREAFSGLVNLTSVQLPNSVRFLRYNSFHSNDALKHIILPENVEAEQFAIQSGNVEHLTIRNQKLPLHQLLSSSEMKHIYFISDDESSFDISDIAERFETVPNVYLNGLESSHTYPTDSKIYCPGATRDKHNSSNTVEMWIYEIHKTQHSISVIPVIDGLEIVSVEINGKINQPSDCHLYEYEPNETLDVVVKYTLNNRQTMATHYTPEFNAEIPDLPSGIDSVIIDSNDFILYNLHGVKVAVNSMNNLLPGIYILKSKSQVKKIVVK